MCNDVYNILQDIRQFNSNYMNWKIWQATSCPASGGILWSIVEPKISLMCLKKHATGIHPESNKSSPQLHTLLGTLA